MPMPHATEATPGGGNPPRNDDMMRMFGFGTPVPRTRPRSTSPSDPHGRQKLRKIEHVKFEPNSAGEHPGLPAQQPDAASPTRSRPTRSSVSSRVPSRVLLKSSFMVTDTASLHYAASRANVRSSTAVKIGCSGVRSHRYPQ